MGLRYSFPRHAALSCATSPLAFLASSVRASPCGGTLRILGVQRTTASRPASHGSRPAPNPLEKRRPPVRFAPISPISAHYSDNSRHAARSRTHRPRSTAPYTIRRTGRLETPSIPVSSSAFPAVRRADYRKVFIPPKVQRTDDVKRTIGFDRSQTSATSGAGTN